MSMSASIISPSSRSSGLVNAAWTGPRRPRTRISLIPFSARASIACSAVSVASSSSRFRPSMRATSVATLPLPITTARSHDEVELVVGEIRVGVVPGDELGGRMAAGEVLAGDPKVPVGRGAVGVDDRVVVVGELGGAHVPADLHVAEEAKALPRGRLLVYADHRFDLRVVGRHAGTHKAERGRKAVEDVHLEVEVLGAQQVLGGVEAGRAGADDGDPQRRGGCAGWGCHGAEKVRRVPARSAR